MEYDELLEEVKEYLKVTWNDEDKEINNLILEAKQDINEQTGTVIDYEQDKVAKGLLKDYCRYARNYSKEYFLHNFLANIQRLQIKYAQEEEISNESET